MNDANEKTGAEATTETKDERAPQPATTDGEVSDAELKGVAGGISGRVAPPVPSRPTG